MSQERTNPRDTVDNATTFVMRRELSHLNSLTIRVTTGEENMADELYKEKKRLDSKGKFDHEEVFIATGFYLTGCKCKKK